ncbi:MAG: serpin family protein [Candidatus Eisenbacteria bacterium]
MAKKFMYVCLGILALVVAFHVGARYGEAETYADHNSGGIIALHSSEVLLHSGEVWGCDRQVAGWTRRTGSEPPIPSSEITSWGRVALPRFELEFGADLNEALKTMGMAIAFGGGADFSGMSAGLFISNVLHKTYVRVDELGTEAAAVTEVDMSTGNTPDCAHFQFWVSRPFIFAIRENQTNTILFIGKVVDPGYY